MERDDDVKGSGNSYDFGARIYDSRIARFLSIDPLQQRYPSESNYCFAGNSPIAMVDNEGKNKTFYIFFLEEKKNQHLSKSDKREIIKKIKAIYAINGMSDVNIVGYNTNKRQDVNIFDHTDKVVYFSNKELLSKAGLNVSNGGNSSQGNDIEAAIDINSYKGITDTRPDVVVNDYLASSASHEIGHNLKSQAGIETDKNAPHPYKTPNLMSPGSEGQLIENIKAKELFRSTEEFLNSESYKNGYRSTQDGNPSLFFPKISPSLNFTNADKTIIQDFVYDGRIGINIPYKGKVLINFVSNDYRNITNTKQGSYLKPQDNASNKFKNATKID
jgi:RHS repeat-associated protein